MSTKKIIQLLHVDDSATLRKTIERGLEAYKDHYVLTQANSAEEAIAFFAAGKKFDVVLTDWQMTGKSGLDLLCILKADPATHHLPVFFLTSEQDTSSVHTAASFGAAGLLKKPASVPEIHAFLQKKTQIIEESYQAKEDSFRLKAKPLLQDLQKLLAPKSSQDMENLLRGVQILKAMTTSSRWPVLANYCLKMEAAVQETSKKGAFQAPPFLQLLTGFHAFMMEAHSSIDAGHAHAGLSADLDKNFTAYSTNLKAGWFDSSGSATAPADGLFLPWDVVAQLQKHLDAEGQKLLAPHLNQKKSVA